MENPHGAFMLREELRCTTWGKGFGWWVGVIVMSACSLARAADLQGDPSNYRDKLAQLTAGDTLQLAAGTYTDLLNVSDLNGDADHWITIRGPATGDAAIFTADPGPCCNTVEIRDSSYVAIQNLVIEGLNTNGAFGISAKDGENNRVHHIRIEGCTLLNHDGSQQTVGISTKTPTWGWEIRNNRILNSGTGLYLGNSDGTQPFVQGIIEYNLISDAIGYCMQIKWQDSRPAVAGMPDNPTSTIIRHNVFIKTDRPSPSGDRPNLLVGGFPDTGAGSADRYEIYSNFFYHNPRESLLQASGRVSIHDNIFVDVAGTAIRLQNHDLPLRLAHVYNNTIYGADTGIAISGTLDEGGAVVGNLIFADTPISGQPSRQEHNLSDSIENADLYVANPNNVLGVMDFYPLAGECEGAPLDLLSFATDTDYDCDFNGNPKGPCTFRGAYAGSGPNPGWALNETRKDSVDDPPPPDATVDGDGTVSGDGATAADGNGHADGTQTNDASSPSDNPLGEGGCSCRSAGPSVPVLWSLFLLSMLCAHRRRRRNSG